jgi:photosystem II stability/assembly factor-like uncharacterized protein
MAANFTVLSGGGSVEPTSSVFNNYIAKTRWKTGISSSIQQLKIEIFNKDNILINTSYLEAYTFNYNKWDTVTCFPDISIRDILPDTIANQTLMIDYRTLYQQKDKYFEWLSKNNFSDTYQLQIDRKGVIYLSAYDGKGKIYKSINHGVSWQECNDPIAENKNFYNINVSPNGYIWASSYLENSFRCSRDGGQTWLADTIGLEKDDYLGDIYFLSNGNILFMSSNMRLYQSSDDGKSWTRMQTPQYPLKLYVTDRDEIIIINQDNGISIYKSTDLGQNYTQKYSIQPKYGTTMKKTIQKINNIYYILIPGYGILKTTDFENFETFVKNTKMVFLYQDHTGTIITRDFENKYTFYYKEN